MSTSLLKIQEAEQEAQQLRKEADEKAHKILEDAEMEANRIIEESKQNTAAQQREKLLAHKEHCAGVLEKSERETAAHVSSLEKKWEGNIPSAVDFVMQSFQKYFS